jgi:hypothetical protein
METETKNYKIATEGMESEPMTCAEADEAIAKLPEGYYVTAATTERRMVSDGAGGWTFDWCIGDVPGNKPALLWR